ncbi:MAG: hypothetical protein D3903_02690 [Candidatus Electrothrix sp. GM3_4]|nr:hypothetical protein [Candidatus Electrothrix sp. GM3_4]
MESRGNRPLKMTFEDQLNALIFFHLEEHTSVRHLVQIYRENTLAAGTKLSCSLPTKTVEGYLRLSYYLGTDYI